MNAQPSKRGAPRSAFVDDDFVIVRGEAVRALGDWNSAGVWQRIAWRCKSNGGRWRVTVGDLAAEVWLSEKQVRRALATLRDAGWIDAVQDRPLDRTLTYSIPWEDERPPGRLARPGGQTRNALQGVSSYREGDNYRDNYCSGSAAEVLSDVLDHHGLDHDAEAVEAAVRTQRPDIEHPAQFIDHLATDVGDFAARGFLDGLGL